MPKYVTVASYRVQDAGVVGTAANAGLSDLSLARTIGRAESDIDAYLAFPLYLNGGFEAHMTGLVQAGFDQYTRKMSNPASPVPIRNAQRYRIHISNASTTGAGLFASINTGDVVLNQGEGYVEIVPLQAITYSLAPIVWDLGLEPPIIEADYEVGFFLPRFGETLYNDSGDLKTYRALNAYWAQTYTQALANQPNQVPPIPPVVYKNGVVQASGYTVSYTEGTVTFTSPLLTADVVTADYTFTIPENVRDACVAQTTWLLALRQVAQMGALPYDLVRNGDQQVRRRGANSSNLATNALCEEALHCLAGYKRIAIA